MTPLERLNRYRVAQGLFPQRDYYPERHDYFVNIIVAPWEVDNPPTAPVEVLVPRTRQELANQILHFLKQKDYTVNDLAARANCTVAQAHDALHILRGNREKVAKLNNKNYTKRPLYGYRP